MNTTTKTATNTEPNDTDLAACACHVYDAECALHAAHQSGVSQWIDAASQHLHLALDAYLRAVADQPRHDEILTRYPPGDPVHRAVTHSRPELLAAAARVRTATTAPATTNAATYNERRPNR